MSADKQHGNAVERLQGPIERVYHVVHDWWIGEVAHDVDHGAVLKKIAGESSLTPRYLFMTCMSAGIAILGMLLSSPAVVIGAMLLSPLMGPMLGAGFALAEGKFTWLRLCGRALVWGTLFAILFCAAIVWLSPLQNVTEEIAARTRPNLFDLLVALFSSLAGSYAMIRGRDGTIVGVAIATALMPPLAAVGFGLATVNWTVFGGALMLFITNLLTIALTAALMARLYGFRSEKQRGRSSWVQSLLIVATFIALAIPLGLALMQIAREANGERLVRAAITESFDETARIDQIQIDWDREPITVSASVLTPDFRSDANNRLSRRLEEALGTSVAVNVRQYRVGTNPGAAEQEQLARARAEEQQRADAAQIAQIKERLALVAGVPREQVTIDVDNRRALADAFVLPGLDLEGYRVLEARAAAGLDGWDVRMRPPVRGLPSIPLEDGELGAEGRRAVSLAGWAANRTGLPITLSGGGAKAEEVAATLREEGVDVQLGDGGSSDTIQLSWATGQGT